jgi:tRNA pseudouridine32 synthase/23S rRNA pseudouridine746 synthase
VLSFLVARLPVLSQAEWAARMAEGGVVGHEGEPLGSGALYRRGELVWYWRVVPGEVALAEEAAVVYQDGHLVVADKPHFLPMSPIGRYALHTLQAQLQRRLGLNTLSPIHRLDRETAGVVVFSVNPEERALYQQMFRDRVVHKVYEAIAPWRTDLEFPLHRKSRIVESPVRMQMHEVEGDSNAETRVEFMSMEAPGWARYRLTPLTGRTHQLRVHMNALGLPLLGDRIYPVLQPEAPASDAPAPTTALCLLARSIAFRDPVTGQDRRFESKRSLLCHLSGDARQSSEAVPFHRAG